MNLYELLLISLALSADAAGVMLSLSINDKLSFKNKMHFVFSFGFFQTLCFFMGGYGGFLFNTYILTVPQVIGGIIMVLVGIFMIKEGVSKDGENLYLNKSIYLILGISVSIDAMVVGFTSLNNINIKILGYYSLFVGLITWIMCLSAILISRQIKKINIITRYADYIGGLIIILFGIKMILI